MQQENVAFLRRRILRNPYCARVFKASNDVYVVGGYLRDLIASGKHSKDIDFVVRGRLRPLVDELSSTMGGRVIDLRKEKMVRLALPRGRTLDFSGMPGSIEKDLMRRDFTINALAWSPTTGLVDPLGGLHDISKGTVRAVNAKNLKDDPVRLLRAYRHSAQMNIPISSATRRIIRPLASKIGTSARERITLEFFKLLNADNPIKQLRQTLSDGLLTPILSSNNNRLRINLKLMSTLMSHTENRHERLLFKDFSHGLTRLGLLRLEILMLGSRLSNTLLSVSSDIRKRVEVTGRLHDKYKIVAKSTRSELFNLISEAGDSAEDLLFITGNGDLMPEIKRFRRIQSRGLITSEEVMKLLGIKGGPRLGRILMDVRRLQFAGVLRTRKAAIRWILNI